MRKISGLMLCLCFLVGRVALGASVALYQGVMPVASQSAAEREQVLQPALGQVLIKVSGNNQILNNTQVKSHLSSAGTLMQEFSYTAAPEANPAKPYLLRLNFDADGINKILRDAGVPIWGQNRPVLLVWLDFEMPNHPAEIIGTDSNTALPAAFKQAMDRRGVPVMFPTMDMQDLSQVTINDLTSMDMAKLTLAAKRYGDEAILVGRIVQDTNGFTTQWKLNVGKDQWGWTITGKTLPDTLAALADNVADSLARRYAAVITNNVQTKLILKIVGIGEADDFEQAMNYLQHLTPVADVDVVRIANDGAILQVNLRGSQTSFTQAVSIGQKLSPVPSDDNSMLIYQWNH
jgi:hypothetical protein